MSEISVTRCGFKFLDPISEPLYCPGKRTLSLSVTFTLQTTKRFILSESEIQEVEEPPRSSPTLSTNLLYDKSSYLPWYQSLRMMISNLVHVRSSNLSGYKDQIITQLAKYVDELIKSHNCPSQPKNFGRRVHLTIALEVLQEHHHRPSPPVYDAPRPIPADEAAIRANLRQVRVEDYSDEEDDKQCGICLEELQLLNKKMTDQEEEVKCLPCKHAFHEGCIVKWLNISHFCPLCRFELPHATELPPVTEERSWILLTDSSSDYSFVVVHVDYY